MSATVQYAIGADIHCEDADYGRLERVVIDPVARRVTHLVVGGRREANRLVPVDLVDEANSEPQDIRLRCDTEAMRRLEAAEETEYLPGTADQLGYQADELVTHPYYGLGVGGMGMAPGLLPLEIEPRVTVHDRVPSGEVQIRHGDRVEAVDGEIGRVQGLVIDPQDHAVTHVLLQEGHLWGRKTVAIPIRELTWTLGGTVKVRLSKLELADLPPVDIDTRS
ncbi:PRC-barrel domain-containing protein [Kitasatospora mediocidica]|uniref:PRC-barrel domain-containing protein n=1 Tax=Kitasatospora mediocidica TaxID=58352 RepID=UPI00055E9B44|nr:PRC-barrel domain-containing protein [Kitasatospora mediocidica]